MSAIPSCNHEACKGDLLVNTIINPTFDDYVNKLLKGLSNMVHNYCLHINFAFSILQQQNIRNAHSCQLSRDQYPMLPVSQRTG